MTIHFSAAVSRKRPSLPAAKSRITIGRPANDNAADELEEAVLHAALQQFSRYGIGAADRAYAQAERAWLESDDEMYRWWLGICRTLDARKAAQLAMRLGGKPRRSR